MFLNQPWEEFKGSTTNEAQLTWDIVLDKVTIGHGSVIQPERVMERKGKNAEKIERSRGSSSN